jgi:DNA-binding NtrC family response regulator
MSQRANILFAEDDKELRTMLSSELSRLGYAIKTVDDGEEAVLQIKNEKFDLALLDIKMPKLNGFEVLKFIKNNFPSMKVIMVTAHSDLTNAIEAKRLGAEDFLGKPFDLEDLVVTIERVLSS